MIPKRTALAALLILLVASARATPPGEVVDRYMAAYNAHDVEGMLELVDPAVRWLAIDGDTLRVEADGAEALGAAMRAYFEAVPTTRSEIESMMVAGSRVSVHERAIWESNGEERSQSALSVYEIAGGRITRVWYFPAE
ncbi:MAG: hypothetical protein GVY11_01635 [Gammaproteobacteria bacterium]|jgi:hypothetical protein|nr:hypothetical protein [Gammaproteobacteria bacterium]